MKLKFMKNCAYQTVNDFRDNPVSFERSSRRLATQISAHHPS